MNVLNDKYKCYLNHDHNKGKFLFRENDFRVVFLFLPHKTKQRRERTAPLNFALVLNVISTTQRQIFLYKYLTIT